jgi:hypothetical protein
MGVMTSGPGGQDARMPRPRTALAAAVLVIGILVAGCGSDDDAGDAAATAGATAAATAPATAAGADLPAITVTAPASGQEVSSPARVTGTANTFEATVRIRLTAADGRILHDGFTTATSGSGVRGTYEESVPFTVDEPTRATLRLFQESAEDGSETDVVEVPLTLVP